MKYLKEPFTLPLLMDFKLVNAPGDSLGIKVKVYRHADKLNRIQVPIHKAKLNAKITMSKADYFKSDVKSKGGTIARIINKPTTDEHGEALIPDVPKQGDLVIKLTATAGGYDPVTINLKREKSEKDDVYMVEYIFPSNRSRATDRNSKLVDLTQEE
jgi:hypothetical protein